MKGAASNIHCRRLTAPGRGAVASIRLSCNSVKDAYELSDAFVAANGTDLATAPANRVLFGSWRGEDVVVVRTGELEWEVHCHGGEAAVTRMLSEFSAEPSRVPDSSTLLDLLLRTRTQKTARLVLAQANGLLQNALIDAACCSEESGFRSRLEELLRWEPVAQHLDQPWRVVIAGPPNVGKSSLLNAIAGYERVIVFDQPGTTRDAVQTELFIDGWPFRFVDTAGIRQESDDPIEIEGIRHAQRLLRSADFVLVAVDHSSGWQSDHETLLSALPEGTLSAVVRCKCDLSPRGNPVPRSIPQLETAAKTGSGITALTNWIVRQLFPIEPSINTPLPVDGSAALCRSLLQRLGNGESLEILRCELREILAESPAGVWKLHGSP